MVHKRKSANGRHPQTTARALIIILITLGLVTNEAVGSFESLLEHKILEEQPLIGLALDEQREPPLFYDTFFPVVYEVDVPTWAAKDLRLELPLNLTNNGSLCNETYNSSAISTDKGAADIWSSTLCPVTLKLNEILDTFAVEMKVFETFNASETKLDSQFSSCHEVKPHFSNHIIDEIEIELYLIQVILDCPMADVIHRKLEAAPPNKTKYTEILKTFIDTHISPRFRIVGYSKYAIATNILLSLHTTELLDYLLDTFSWTTSINTCNSQRIPRLLVPQTVLKSTLMEIQTKIASKDLKLAIPIADISNYYKLQLADCVTTTSGSYIIRILVPLVKQSVTYKLIRINPIPFLNHDNTSAKTMICQHRTLEGSLVINAKTMQPLARVKCEEAELCRIPPEGDRPVFSKCHTAALLNDTKGMLESCHMACLSYDPTFLPYIKRIRSDQFVVVGTSSADIAVTCKKEVKTLSVSRIPTDIGSMLITLPCSCYLAHRSEKYEINGPCDFHLEMKPIRPMGWTYDILLEHFHHKKRLVGKDDDVGGAGALLANSSKGSNVDLPEGDSADDEDFNEVMLCNQSSGYTTWPIYLAYVLLLVGSVFIAGGFYTLRNVYVRIGQLEMSTALSSGNRISTFTVESGYNRNAAVAFNARTNPAFTTDESVY